MDQKSVYFRLHSFIRAKGGQKGQSRLTIETKEHRVKSDHSTQTHYLHTNPNCSYGKCRITFLRADD